VVDIGLSGVWTFHLSIENGKVNFKQLGFVKVSPEGALHGRFYKPGNGKTYGVISNGYFVNTSSLIIVDLTDPYTPTVLSSFPMSRIALMVIYPFFSPFHSHFLLQESVFIHKNYVMVGGFHNDVFQVVNITDPSSPAIVKTLIQPYYLQMVSSSTESPLLNSVLDENVLYTALWGDKGGLATFNMSDPANLHELSHIVNGDLGRGRCVFFLLLIFP
jgi:hypothetical protein